MEMARNAFSKAYGYKERHTEDTGVIAKAFQESLCTGSTHRRKSYRAGEVSQRLLTALEKDNRIYKT